MKCSRCGKNLNEDAVFCDNCGAFVMNFQYNTLPENGYRTRNKNKRSKTLAIICLALVSIFIGIGSGYLIIHRDIVKREAKKYSNSNIKTHSEIWEKSLISNIQKY